MIRFTFKTILMLSAQIELIRLIFNVINKVYRQK